MTKLVRTKTEGKEEVIEEPFQFEATIKKENIEDFLKSISILVEEGRMTINENGIETKVVDPTNICMVTTTLKKEGTFRYSISGKRTVGIPVKKILKLIGKAKKNEAIQIEYLPKTDKRDERVKITFGTLQYDLALIRVDTIRKTPKTPKINLPVKITMRSAKFRQTIALVSEITDEITFTVPAGEDKLTAEGTGEMAETHILITIENGDLLKFEDERMDENEEKDDRAMVSRFPVEELDKISKIVANKGEVTLQMDTDYPCKVITSFADDQGSIEYLLAPRVDD